MSTSPATLRSRSPWSDAKTLRGKDAKRQCHRCWHCLFAVPQKRSAEAPRTRCPCAYEPAVTLHASLRRPPTLSVYITLTVAMPAAFSALSRLLVNPPLAPSWFVQPSCHRATFGDGTKSGRMRSFPRRAIARIFLIEYRSRTTKRRYFSFAPCDVFLPPDSHSSSRCGAHILPLL
jgi:hypothetical protein